MAEVCRAGVLPECGHASLCCSGTSSGASPQSNRSGRGQDTLGAWVLLGHCLRKGYRGCAWTVGWTWSGGQTGCLKSRGHPGQVEGWRLGTRFLRAGRHQGLWGEAVEYWWVGTVPRKGLLASQKSSLEELQGKGSSMQPWTPGRVAHSQHKTPTRMWGGRRLPGGPLAPRPRWHLLRGQGSLFPHPSSCQQLFP